MRWRQLQPRQCRRGRNTSCCPHGCTRPQFSPKLDRADRTHSSECNHLHRLPAAAGISEQGRDIFGRDKHGDYRDDMGGVGSLQRVNRTLYVGRIIEEADSFERRSCWRSGRRSSWRLGCRSTTSATSSAGGLRARQAWVAER